MLKTNRLTFTSYETSACSLLSTEFESMKHHSSWKQSQSYLKRSLQCGVYNCWSAALKIWSHPLARERARVPPPPIARPHSEWAVTRASRARRGSAQGCHGLRTGKISLRRRCSCQQVIYRLRLAGGRETESLYIFFLPSPGFLYSTPTHMPRYGLGKTPNIPYWEDKTISSENSLRKERSIRLVRIDRYTSP